jgi:hypothetical protein
MRVHQNTKTNTKTRQNNGVRGTASRLNICTLSSANSPHRRANSAKKTNCLSLTALCVMMGLTLWACLLHQRQPSKSKQTISCRGSCSISISASQKRACTRDINTKRNYLKYQDILSSRRDDEFESERVNRNNIPRKIENRLSSNSEIKSHKVRSLKILERSPTILNPPSHKSLVFVPPVFTMAKKRRKTVKSEEDSESEEKQELSPAQEEPTANRKKAKRRKTVKNPPPGDETDSENDELSPVRKTDTTKNSRLRSQKIKARRCPNIHKITTNDGRKMVVRKDISFKKKSKPGLGENKECRRGDMMVVNRCQDRKYVGKLIRPVV